MAALTGALALSFLGCRPPRVGQAPDWPPITFTSTDRVLILAPHPDDEVLGCGGIIQQAVPMRIPVRVVFFTYGDNNQWSFLVYRKHLVLTPIAVRRMGLVRHDEAVAAAHVLGLSDKDLTFFGYPDFGTLPIWNEHWGERPPFQSMLTRVRAVPYANALRPGAPYKGEEVLRDLEQVLRQFQPTKVFVSHPGDHMPDHAALYLFTRVALWDLAKEMSPELYAYLLHFRHWPLPRGFRPSEPLEPPRPFREPIVWRSHPLRPGEVERKRSAITAHRTQYRSSAQYLLSFIRPNELFGDFPSLPLSFSASPVPLSADGHRAGSGPSRAPEQLTDEERAAFVGVEERLLRLEGQELVMSMRFSRPFAAAVGASIFIFGYRGDRPFGQMPKIHVRLGRLGIDATDQGRPLPKDTVIVHRGLKDITVRLPLSILGAPEKILTSARTYLGEVPLDWVSWRILELPLSSGAAPRKETAGSGG